METAAKLYIHTFNYVFSQGEGSGDDAQWDLAYEEAQAVVNANGFDYSEIEEAIEDLRDGELADYENQVYQMYLKSEDAEALYINEIQNC